MRIQIFVIILLVLALVTFPYIYAARSAGPDFFFGGFLLNPRDGNSYLAKMYEGWRGEWRFTLPYTAEPGQGAYLFLFYIFLGHLARIMNLSLIWTFHLARILAAVIMLLALYNFMAAILSDSRWQIWVFALAALGSGMGWVVLPFGAFTSDFWVAEAYPFLSAYANPHFTLGLAILLYLLTIPPLKIENGNRIRKGDMGWLAALGALALAIMAPFGVVIALVMLVGLMAWDLWRRLFLSGWISARPRRSESSRAVDQVETGRFLLVMGRFFWVLLGGVPLLLYDFWVVRVNPILAGWNTQNLTPSPPLWDLVVSLSPAFILALTGAWWYLKCLQRSEWSSLIWVGLGIPLLYLPFGLQRRFMMGLFVPVVGLAGLGLGRLTSGMSKRIGLLATVFFVLSLPTNMLILLAAQHGIQTHDPLLYLTRGEALAFDWIKENTHSRALILAAPETGMFIPAHTGRRVIYGHPFETVNAEAEQEAVNRFFTSRADEQLMLWCSDFMIQRNVDYVFFGPREEKLGGIPIVDGLNEVYSVEDVTIYEMVAR